jgi:hypothetical protein
MTIHNPGLSGFTPIARHDFAVNAGAAGWVDTDASAFLPIGAIGVFAVVPEASVIVGVRRHGSAIDTSWTLTAFTEAQAVAYGDAAGHVDLWRNATNNVHYNLIGYYS